MYESQMNVWWVYWLRLEILAEEAAIEYTTIIIVKNILQSSQEFITINI